MNKKQGYQGFRKFSIKTRLVIALLLISIIPLAGISGYSFHIFSVALREKLSASISQTLSMINLNMVSEIEKYQYLCGSICISEEIKDGLLNKDMSDIEKNQAINEIQSMIRTKIIYPAQAKNITVYDTDGNIFYDLGYDGFYQNDVDMLLDRCARKIRMYGRMCTPTATEISWSLEEESMSSTVKAASSVTPDFHR